MSNCTVLYNFCLSGLQVLSISLHQSINVRFVYLYLYTSNNLSNYPCQSSYLSISVYPPGICIQIATCVYALMGFQVGAFCVDFRAAQEITVVGPPLLQFRIVSPAICEIKLSDHPYCWQWNSMLNFSSTFSINLTVYTTWLDREITLMNYIRK
jgi:hypothetical protein